MRRQLIRVGVVALAMLASAVAPAFAQDKPGDIGVGISFLGDEGGVGAQGTLARKIKDLQNDRILQWVADVSFHHNSLEFTDVSFNTFMVQGGVRVRAAINDKTDWFAHGMLGIRRISAGSDAVDEACGSIGLDCGLSDTGLIFTPGAGIDYAFNPKTSVRAQLDIPFGDGGSTTRFLIGLAWKN